MRITRESAFAGIVRVLAERSTCTRKHVGALIVRDKRIIATGYNGSPSGLPHCEDVGCLVGPDGGCLRTIHAEQNSIAFASRYGIATDGAELWTSVAPCLPCAKLIINAGIRRVVYLEDYRDHSGLELLSAARVETAFQR